MGTKKKSLFQRGSSSLPTPQKRHGTEAEKDVLEKTSGGIKSEFVCVLGEGKA